MGGGATTLSQVTVHRADDGVGMAGYRCWQVSLAGIQRLNTHSRPAVVTPLSRFKSRPGPYMRLTCDNSPAQAFETPLLSLCLCYAPLRKTSSLVHRRHLISSHPSSKRRGGTPGPVRGPFIKPLQPQVNRVRLAVCTACFLCCPAARPCLRATRSKPGPASDGELVSASSRTCHRPARGIPRPISADTSPPRGRRSARRSQDPSFASLVDSVRAAVCRVTQHRRNDGAPHQLPSAARKTVSAPSPSVRPLPLAPRPSRQRWRPWPAFRTRPSIRLNHSRHGAGTWDGCIHGPHVEWGHSPPFGLLRGRPHTDALAGKVFRAQLQRERHRALAPNVKVPPLLLRGPPGYGWPWSKNSTSSPRSSPLAVGSDSSRAKCLVSPRPSGPLP